jgi:solute:Na+ symporter, SSS family
VLAAVSIALGAALAARDQGIVDTMVSVNVIYIASVGVVFAALLRGIVVPVAHAGVIMAVGFSVAFATYVAGWTGWVGESADIFSLVAGLGASATMAVCCALSPNRVPDGGSSVRG